MFIAAKYYFYSKSIAEKRRSAGKAINNIEINGNLKPYTKLIIGEIFSEHHLKRLQRKYARDYIFVAKI